MSGGGEGEYKYIYIYKKRGGGGVVNSRSSNRCTTKSCPNRASELNVQTQQEYMVTYDGVEVKAALAMPVVGIHVQTQQEYRSHHMVKHDGVEVKAALTMPMVWIHTCTNTTGI